MDTVMHACIDNAPCCIRRQAAPVSQSIRSVINDNSMPLEVRTHALRQQLRGAYASQQAKEASPVGRLAAWLQIGHKYNLPWLSSSVVEALGRCVRVCARQLALGQPVPSARPPRSAPAP